MTGSVEPAETAATHAEPGAPPVWRTLLGQAWSALGGGSDVLEQVASVGEGTLPSVYNVSDLAVTSVGAAGAALSELLAVRTGQVTPVTVDRRLASLWFGLSIRPEGWEVPPVWDAVAGDYATADGWIKLHMNSPHHRAAGLKVLGVPEDRVAVARAVATWRGADLERAFVENGGCAAQLRRPDEWDAHPQGAAVAAEPLVHIFDHPVTDRPDWSLDPARPLHGLRVLDLTRVIAGPVAARFMAGLGADVLRVDPPFWNEPGIAPEMTLGKRTARLDLRLEADRATLAELLRGADVLVHGYRANALVGLGFGPEERRRLRPGLVDVCLDAYGWSGPWQFRRGYDSLVQMSAGIADEGMRRTGKDEPFSMPVQALDHATGYLLAAAILRGLTVRASTGAGWQARASLARTARWLVDAGSHDLAGDLTPKSDTAADLADGVEHTHWGPARRLRPPVSVGATTLRWDRPAGLLGAVPAAWA